MTTTDSFYSLIDNLYNRIESIGYQLVIYNKNLSHIFRKNA